MSCSFCLRASQPPTHPTPRDFPLRVCPLCQPLTLLAPPPRISERGSISADRVPRPSHSTHPLHGNESRERRGKKATTVGRHERGRAIPAVTRTSERRKTERGKDGRETPSRLVVRRGGGENAGRERERPTGDSPYFIVAFADANRRGSVRRGETRRGICLRREFAREEKSERPRTRTHGVLIREKFASRTNSRSRSRAGGTTGTQQGDCRRPRESVWQRWCPYPHQTARHVDLDPPTRLADGKPSRKNRPPFRGRKRTTATTLPPPTTTTTVSGEREFSCRSRFSRHRATTTSAILSLLYPPAPSALCTRRLLLRHDDQPSSRGISWVTCRGLRPRAKGIRASGYGQCSSRSGECKTKLYFLQ